MEANPVRLERWHTAHGIDLAIGRIEVLRLVQSYRYVFVLKPLEVEHNSDAVGRAAGVEIVELQHGVLSCKHGLTRRRIGSRPPPSIIIRCGFKHQAPVSGASLRGSGNDGALSGEPRAQPVEIYVQHRRDVERHSLTDDKSAHHGKSERLAPFAARAPSNGD